MGAALSSRSRSSHSRKAGRAQVAARVVDRLSNSGAGARGRGDGRGHEGRPALGRRGLAGGADPAGLDAGDAAAVDALPDPGGCGYRGGACGAIVYGVCSRDTVCVPQSRVC